MIKKKTRLTTDEIELLQWIEKQPKTEECVSC